MVYLNFLIVIHTILIDFQSNIKYASAHIKIQHLLDEIWCYNIIHVLNYTTCIHFNCIYMMYDINYNKYSITHNM